MSSFQKLMYVNWMVNKVYAFVTVEKSKMVGTTGLNLT